MKNLNRAIHITDFGSRHSREGGNPGCKHVFKSKLKTWIPAFAGMTGVSTAGFGLIFSLFSSMAYAAPYLDFPNTPHVPNLTDPAWGLKCESLRNGIWSDPTIWSCGHVPGSEEAVAIHTSVTIAQPDAMAKWVVIDTGELIFSPTVNTGLRTDTVQVLDNGRLTMGTAVNPIDANVTARLEFTNTFAFDRSSTGDPAQYLHGLFAAGMVTIHGSPRTPAFVRLASEPKPGDTQLSMSENVSGWKSGDKLLLPDTRQQREGTVSQLEALVVAGVLGDRRTLSLQGPLQYAHKGARDGEGKLDFLGHVGNFTRNVVITSQDPAGARGHAFFIHRAIVDIRYALFSHLGRTKLVMGSPPETTTFDPSGNIISLANNENFRFPLYMHYVIGPASIPSNGYQFTLLGNAIDGGNAKSIYSYGICLRDSHYGLVQDNVVDNVAGGGLVLYSGSESYNLVDYNFLLRANELNSNSDPNGDLPYGFAHNGSGLGLRGPNNFVTNNVTANSYSYGILIFPYYSLPGRIPVAQGLDTYTSGNLYAKPLLRFEGNESYSNDRNMLIGGIGDQMLDASAQRSFIKDFRSWHQQRYGIHFHGSNRFLTFDGTIMRGDEQVLIGNPEGGPYGPNGFFFYDKGCRGLIIDNANIQLQGTGINLPPALNGGADFPVIIKNSFLSNVYDIRVISLWGRRAYVTPRHVLIDNVVMKTPRALTGDKADQWRISLEDQTDLDPRFVCRDVPDDIFFRQCTLNGVLFPDTYQIFYRKQHPHAIFRNSFLHNGLTGSPNIGAPVHDIRFPNNDPSLTNAVTAAKWKRYIPNYDGTHGTVEDGTGMCFAGSLSPCTDSDPTLCSNALAFPSKTIRGDVFLTGRVNTPPLVSLTNPINEETFDAPATISLIAEASDSDGSVALVEFFEDTNKWAEDSTTPYSFDWKDVPPGVYILMARATDNQGAITISTPVTIRVRDVPNSKPPLPLPVPPPAPVPIPPGQTLNPNARVGAFNPHKGEELLTFCDPDESYVIRNAMGHIVYEGHGTTWNGSNSSGKTATSAVYAITCARGEKRKGVLKK